MQLDPQVFLVAECFRALQGLQSAYCILYVVKCKSGIALQCMAQITLRCTDRNWRHPSLSVASIPPTMSDPPVSPTIRAPVEANKQNVSQNHKRQRYPSLNATNQVRLNTSIWEQEISYIHGMMSNILDLPLSLVYLFINCNAMQNTSRALSFYSNWLAATQSLTIFFSSLLNNHISRCDQWQTPLLFVLPSLPASLSPKPS